MYRLITFGGLTLIHGDEPVAAPLLQRSQLALLAVIASAGFKGISRDKLIALFWPEADTEHARRALNQNLYSTRRQLGSDDAVLGSSDLRVNPSIVSSDVTEFEKAVAEQEWERAASLYKGPFLDGIHMKGSAEFERWSAAQRTRYEGDFVRAVETLAQSMESTGDHAGAAGWWRRLAMHDLLNGRYTAALIRALGRSGDYAAAVAQYKAHELALQQDLGATPSSSVLSALAEVEDLARGNGRVLGPTREEFRVASSAESPARHIESPQRAPSPRNETSFPWRKRRTLAFASMAAAGVVVLLIAGSRYNPGSSAAATGDLMQTRVAIGDFENGTGDSTWNVFSRVLSESIRSGIAQTGLVPVIDATTGGRAAVQRGKSAGVTSAIDAAILIAGAFYTLKDSLEIHVRLIDPKANRLISSIRPVTVARDDQRRALSLVLSRVSGALAQRLDDRLGTISPESSPPDYAAYLDYIAGLELWQDVKPQEAARLFESAFEKDTSFAAALLWASITAGRPKNREHMHRLVPLRSKLAPVDRHGLDFLLAIRDSTPDKVPRALAAARRAAALAPQSHWAWNVAYALMGMDRYSEAADALLALDPTRGWLRGTDGYWTMLASALHRSNRYREERQALLRGLSLHGLESPRGQELALGLVRAAAALRDSTEMQRWLNVLLALENPRILEHQRWDLEHAGVELLFHGYPRAAADVLNEAVARNREWSRVVRNKARSAEWEGNHAFRGRVLAHVGRFQEAEATLDTLIRHLLEASRKPPPGPGLPLASAYGWRGFSRARRGDSAGAAASLRELSAVGAQNYGNDAWFMEAAIHAALGEADKSVLALKRARSRGLFTSGMSHLDFVLFLPSSRHPAMSEIFREHVRLSQAR